MSDALIRLRALEEVLGELASAVGRDQTTALEAIRRGAEAVLDCDAAGILLVRAGEPIAFDRALTSPFGAARGAATAPAFHPPALLLELLQRGEVAFFEYFRGAFSPELIDQRPWLSDFASALYAPIRGDGQLVGALFAGWFQQRSGDETILVSARALGRCAAMALRVERLLANPPAR